MHTNYLMESPTITTYKPMGAISARESSPRSNSTNMSINYPMVSPILTIYIPMETL